MIAALRRLGCDAHPEITSLIDRVASLDIFASDTYALLSNDDYDNILAAAMCCGVFPVIKSNWDSYIAVDLDLSRAIESDARWVSWDSMSMSRSYIGHSFIHSLDAIVQDLEVRAYYAQARSPNEGQNDAALQLVKQSRRLLRSVPAVFEGMPDREDRIDLQPSGLGYGARVHMIGAIKYKLGYGIMGRSCLQCAEYYPSERAYRTMLIDVVRRYPMYAAARWMLGKVFAIVGDSSAACREFAGALEGDWGTFGADGLGDAIVSWVDVEDIRQYLRVHNSCYRSIAAHDAIYQFVVCDSSDSEVCWRDAILDMIRTGDHCRAFRMIIGGFSRHSWHYSGRYSEWCRRRLCELYDNCGLCSRARIIDEAVL